MALSCNDEADLEPGVLPYLVYSFLQPWKMLPTLSRSLSFHGPTYMSPCNMLPTKAARRWG